MARIDVTVHGAGIFGLSIAHACAARGARVRVIDPHGIGAGSSGGIVGALAPHTPENWNEKKQFQFDSLRMAEAFWRGVDALSGLSSGYARLGRVQPVADARALEMAHARAVTAGDLWQGHATWDVIAAGGDWEPASPTGWLIRDTLTARLHPRQACDSLAAAIVAQGGEITQDGADEGAVVWATGWQGLAALSEAFGKTVGAGVKGQAALLALDRRGQPQLFADGVHIVPHADGTTAVGSTSEREFTAPASTDAQLDDVVAKARMLCPALADVPVIARWAGVRPRARTRAPILGAWPGRPGHLIANGGFKIGFGMAPKVAEVMADMVLDGHGAIPEGFRVEANL
ncbi:NAD(P)/FAD-dependent oxidoreductase [Anianabacter salinae]|uniref:NAD(P)/FAD-dependent oxidoreductase n=1 Tax=Anianabacter salinae TaxID=2851023 RepID=UPI00225DD182|nr:FAD-dependent oxidoreductase [Anianabacter salinae]MBV0913280.1 FAD-binding oxidoreductase [Anianabacter salinae]